MIWIQDYVNGYRPSTRHRLGGKNLSRDRPINRVDRQRLGLTLCERKKRGMRKTGNISKCCLGKVLQCRRKKPLGLFCKGYFISKQTLYRLNFSHQSSVHPLIFSNNESIKIRWLSPGAPYGHSDLKRFHSLTVLWLLHTPYAGTLTYSAARGPALQLLGISFTIQDLLRRRKWFIFITCFLYFPVCFLPCKTSHASVELFLVIHKAYFIIVLWKCLYNSYEMVILDSC